MNGFLSSSQSIMFVVPPSGGSIADQFTARLPVFRLKSGFLTNLRQSKQVNAHECRRVSYATEFCDFSCKKTLVDRTQVQLSTGH